MKKIVSIVAVVAVLVVMALTCPDEEAHQARVKREVKTAVSNEMEKVLGKNISFYASIATNLATNLAVDNMVRVSNYGLVSVGTLDWGDETHLVSVGVFGHVFSVGHEFLEEKIEEYVRQKVPFL